ncbi:MAG: hypothetical protein IPH78_11950 [Bacteroidetes bacterium]|nr:hypothetical protein [Bacteroidota bacterium]
MQEENTPTPLSPDEKKAIVDEQFWFTATTVGLNSLVISSSDKIHLNLFMVLIFGLLSLFAFILVLNRAAKYASYNGYKQLEGYPGCSYDGGFSKVLLMRMKLTWWEIKGAIRYLPFAIVEFSGCLFYLSLIVCSYIGLFYL